MKAFKMHVLPVILAVLIVVFGGGIMFFAMRFGFNFQDKVIVNDNSDGGMLYSTQKQKKLTDMSLWTGFESSDKIKSFEEIISEDPDRNEYEILKTIPTLARLFLGRITTDGDDITVDLSNARIAVITPYTITAESEKLSDYNIFVDNCIVSFDKENVKYSLRLMFRDGIELMFFEFENLAAQEYTADEVNSAYQYIEEDLKSISQYRYYSLFDLNTDIDGTQDSILKNELAEYETFSYLYPVNYYSTIYNYLARNTYFISMDNPDIYANNLYPIIYGLDPVLTYSDGNIYIKWNSYDTAEEPELMLKYSVADHCITGMCLS